MSTSTVLKLACIVLVCLAMTTKADITCGQVTQKLAPCLGFLESGQGPSFGCCQGVKDLKSMAATVSDKRSACRCLKSAAAAFPDINPALTAVLPGKCGVSLSIAVGSQTDCSKIN